MKRIIFLILWVFISINSYSQLLTGTTFEGGQNGNGELFTINIDGNVFEELYSFPLYYGPMHHFVNHNNGKVICYGKKNVSSNTSTGVILEYSPENHNLDVIFEFPDVLPGSIIYDSLNDVIFGTIVNTIINYNAIFKYDFSTSEYNVLYHFPDSLGLALSGEIAMTNDSIIYGTSRLGGLNHGGIIYSYDVINNEFDTVINFIDTLGVYPREGVMLANNGKLYGTTLLGGQDFDSGVLFEYDLELGKYKVIANFSDSLGREPHSLPIDIGDNKLYGLTYEGGTNHVGVLYEYDYINDNYSIIYSFDESAAWPLNSLNELQSGILYGASNGSNTGYGAIFKYDVNSETFEIVSELNCDIGSFPSGEFHKCENGQIISSTSRGSAVNYGSLFSLDMEANDINRIFSYNGYIDFFNAIGTPVYKNDRIYCLTKTNYFLNSFYCTLFSYDYKSMEPEIKDDFYDVAGSLSSSDHKLFYFGSIWDNFNVIAYDIDSGKVVGTPVGYGTGHMTLADDGYLYGMKIPWGENPFKIFKFDPNTYSLGTVLNHYGPNKPKPYENSLTAGSDGMLYGVAAYSGADSSGVIFEFNIDSEEYVELFDFSNSTALNPSGELVEVEDSVFYALTQLGGDYGAGTIFRFIKSTNTVEIVHSFAGADGANPTGSLMLASNGKLYGMTTNGGAFDLGVVFEFDPVTGDYNKILDFNGENGSHPRYSALTEICDEPEILSNPQDVEAVEGDTVMFVVSAESDDLTGYQWYHFTNPVIGATDDTLIIAGVSAEDEGQYYCEVSATCVSVKSETAGLTIVTGIDEKESKIGIYPNPVRDVLNLTFPTSGKSIEVNIYNYRGQLLLSGEITGSGTVKYDVSDLSPGLYVVKVVSEEKSIFAKFVKN